MPETKNAIMAVNSLPDAILLAAEQAEQQHPKKFMVLDQETTSGDILYGVHPMNTSVGEGENLGDWNVRLVIQARQKR